MARPRTPVLARMRAKYRESVLGCWEWQGALHGRGGYGYVRDEDGRGRQAHVVMYEQLVGPVPPGLELDHTCRNARCIRPQHMEPVTHAENLRRAGVLWTTDTAPTMGRPRERTA